MSLVQRGPLSGISAQDSTRIESCAVLGRDVSYGQCDRYGSQIHNCREMCVGCSSPRRRCVACVEQGFIDELSIVARRKKYCQFHLDNSPDAVRDPITDTHSAFIGFKRPPPQPERPAEPERKKRSVDAVKLNALAAEVPQEQIQAMALIVPKMHATKIRLLEGIALDKKGSELADIARLDEKSLTGKQTDMHRILGTTALPQVQGLSSFEKGYIYRVIGKRVFEAFDNG